MKYAACMVHKTDKYTYCQIPSSSHRVAIWRIPSLKTYCYVQHFDELMTAANQRRLGPQPRHAQSRSTQWYVLLLPVARAASTKEQAPRSAYHSGRILLLGHVTQRGGSATGKGIDWHMCAVGHQIVLQPPAGSEHDTY